MPEIKTIVFGPYDRTATGLTANFVSADGSTVLEPGLPVTNAGTLRQSWQFNVSVALASDLTLYRYELLKNGVDAGGGTVWSKELAGRYYADVPPIVNSDGSVNVPSTGVQLSTSQPNYAPAKASDVPTVIQIRTEMDANSTKLVNLDSAVSTRATAAQILATPANKLATNSDGSVNANTTGSGPNSITITITDGTNPLQNVSVSAWDATQQAFVGVTNSSGQVTFALNSGTYTINRVKPGYNSGSSSLVVSGNATPSYTMTALSITPSDPGETTGWLLCLDEQGNPQAGVRHTIIQVGPANGTTGNSYSKVPRTVQSDNSGLVTVTGHIPGGSYRINRENGPQQSYVAASDTFQLPSCAG